jgi:hypothetical protein
MKGSIAPEDPLEFSSVRLAFVKCQRLGQALSLPPCPLSLKLLYERKQSHLPSENSHLQEARMKIRKMCVLSSTHTDLCTHFCTKRWMWGLLAALCHSLLPVKPPCTSILQRKYADGLSLSMTFGVTRQGYNTGRSSDRTNASKFSDMQRTLAW